MSMLRAGLRSAVAGAAVALAGACITLTLAVNAGARARLEAAASTDRTLLTITPALVRAPPGRGVGRFLSPNLALDDAADLRADVAGVRAVVAVLEGARFVKLGRSTVTASVRGVTPEYLRIREFAVEHGRALDVHDGVTRSRVAVVGAFVARRLQPQRTIVGETVRIGGVPFEVVGQLAAKGLSSDGSNEDNQLLVPFETAARRLFNADALSAVLVQATDPGRVPEVTDSARGLLRRNHALDASVVDDFEILSAIRADAAAAARDTLIQRAAQITSVITLLVACAGVLIVTALNVTDRLPEIGLRLAIGARRTDVALAFIAEAGWLGALGGSAGAASSALGVAALAALTEWPIELDAAALIGPPTAALVLAMAFGAAPAVLAARLAPVEALARG
jgi:putative ABC transport system permease protein